jgi:sortase A
MDDEQKKRVEELARERVKMAFGQQRIDEETAKEVNQLLEHESDNSLFGKSEVLSESQQNIANSEVAGSNEGAGEATQVNVYGTATQSTARVTDNVEEYHKAWQEYYRKYYQYHFGQEMQKKDEEHKAEVQNLLSQEDEIDQNARLMQRLRQQVRNKTHSRVRKFRRSKHYIPIVLGLAVFLTLLFIQYNRAFFAFITAYITPVGNASGLEMLSTDDASGPSRLMIPKINVSVPINFNCALDQASQRACMKNGIMHFAVSGADALPGQFGNFALSGHSSNDAFGGGDYKFIFAQLPRLVEGDLAYVNYENVRYTYVVYDVKVVDPDNVSALQIGNDRPVMTLITCYPIGTARQRMLIFMNQIAPAPGGDAAGDAAPVEDVEGRFAGVTPTLLERLWARVTGGGL